MITKIYEGANNELMFEPNNGKTTQISAGIKLHTLTKDSQEYIIIKNYHTNEPLFEGFFNEITDQTGANYPDVATFKTAIKSFFELATGSGGVLAEMSVLNGMSSEQQKFDYKVVGSEIIVEVQSITGGDMHYLKGGVYHTLNCTTNTGTNGSYEVTMQQGTATEPIVNYIYAALDSSAVLQLYVTTAFPNAKDVNFVAFVARFVVQTDVEFSSHGFLASQRATEVVASAIQFMRVNMRWKQSYAGGLDQDLQITTNVSTLDNVNLVLQAGKVFQLHLQDFPNYDVNTQGIFVHGINPLVTHPLSNWQKITDLNEIRETAEGVTIVDGDYYPIFIWGNVNYTQNECKLFAKLPRSTYSSASEAIADVYNYIQKDAPTMFTTTAFPVALVVLKYESANGGTFVNVANQGLTIIQNKPLVYTTPNYPNTYPNSYDATVSYTEVGANKVRLNFTAFDTETNYDFIYIMDGAGTVVQTLTGNLATPLQTQWVQGDTIQVRFRSDSSVQRTGCATDEMLYEKTLTTSQKVIDLRNGQI